MVSKNNIGQVNKLFSHERDFSLLSQLHQVVNGIEIESMGRDMSKGMLYNSNSYDFTCWGVILL